jgi:hypothetical protein
MARILCALAFAGTALVSGTHAVTVTAQGYPLVCGRVTGLVEVEFPKVVHLPRTIPPGAVTLNGRPASSVSIDGRSVTMIAARPPGVTCLSIVLGRLTIAFAPRAHVDVGTARTAIVVRAARTYRARVAP